MFATKGWYAGNNDNMAHMSFAMAQIKRRKSVRSKFERLGGPAVSLQDIAGQRHTGIARLGLCLLFNKWLFLSFSVNQIHVLLLQISVLFFYGKSSSITQGLTSYPKRKGRSSSPRFGVLNGVDVHSLWQANWEPLGLGVDQGSWDLGSWEGGVRALEISPFMASHLFYGEDYKMEFWRRPRDVQPSFRPS